MELGDHFLEALRLVRASERLCAMAEPIKAALAAADGTLEIAPELAPEIEQMKDRLLELTEHIVAAGAVLTTKLAIITDSV